MGPSNLDEDQDKRMAPPGTGMAPSGSSELLSDLYVPLKTIQVTRRASVHLREVEGTSEAGSTL